MNLLSNFYDKAWQSIIKPFKQNYNMRDLGSRFAKIGTIQIERTDFEVTNHQGHRMKCSFYRKSDQPNIKECVVFCHGVNSSRIDGLKNYAHLCCQDLAFCSFDFSGSGISEGDYVTYGLKESEDLECVIKELKSRFGIQEVSLWGRSMGSVTILIFAQKHCNIRIKSMILDSPFTTVSEIVQNIAYEKYNIASIGVKALLLFIQSKIIEKTGYDIMKIDSREYVKQIMNIPCLILYSNNDKYVDKAQVEELFNLLSSNDKELQLIQGNHNSIRSNEDIYYAQQFIVQRFYTTKGNSYGFRNINTSDFQNSQVINFNQQNSSQNRDLSRSNNYITTSQKDNQKKILKNQNEFFNKDMGKQKSEQTSCNDINHRKSSQQLDNQSQFNKSQNWLFRNNIFAQSRNQQISNFTNIYQSQSSQQNLDQYEIYSRIIKQNSINHIQSPITTRNRIFENNKSPVRSIINSPNRLIASPQRQNQQNIFQQQKKKIFGNGDDQSNRYSVGSNYNIYNQNQQNINQGISQFRSNVQINKPSTDNYQFRNQNVQGIFHKSHQVKSHQSIDFRNQSQDQPNYTNHYQNIFKQKPQFH